MASFHNADTVQNQAGHQIIHGNVNFYGGSAASNERPWQESSDKGTVKRQDDFAFRGPAGICLGQAPYIDPGLFVGREAELCEMDAILRPGHDTEQPRRLVLGGQGGVGKTQLVIAYVNQHRLRHYQSVFWVDATSKATVEQSYKSIADHLFDNQHVRALDGTKNMNYVHRWLSDRRNTRWLIVLDNYDEPDQYNLQDYYPLASHGAIIITTRRPDLVPGETIHLKTIADTSDGLEILATRSQRAGTRTDAYAQRLAARLGGLPLALATAGAYLRSSNISFKHYLHEYEKQWNVDPYRPVRLPEYQNRTLHTTWDLSYDRLKEEDSAAAELLKLYAYFDNHKIWYDLLHSRPAEGLPEALKEAVTDEGRFLSAMKSLTEYSFVEPKESTAVWSIHNCVHDWTLAVLNKGIDPPRYWHAFDCVIRLADPDDWHRYNQLSYAETTAHALRLVQGRVWQDICVKDIAPHRLAHMRNFALLLSAQNHFLAAERVFLRQIDEYQKTEELETLSALVVFDYLGSLYLRQKRLAEAEQMYQRALHGFEKKFGAAHVKTLDAIGNTGLLYQRQGKLTEAEQMFKRALTGQERLLGSENFSTLGTVHNLGLLYHQQGKIVEAERMLQRALAGAERVFGPQYKFTIDIVTNLGKFYYLQGRFDEAAKMFKRAFTDATKVLGSNHPATLQVKYLLTRQEKKEAWLKRTGNKHLMES